MNLSPLFTFIVHHFIRARVKEVTIFNCWDYKAQLDFARYANEKLLWTQMVDIGKDLQFPGGYLNGLSPVLGVLVDFNCNKTVDILNMASGNELFTKEYDWLLIDEQNQLSKIQLLFDRAMMSVDAQITYVASTHLYPRNSSRIPESFITYDIYNNGKFLGGKLNITIDKNVTCQQGTCQEKYLSDLHKRTKYGNRCTLNDTMFRVSVVVTGIPINNSEEKLIQFLSSMGDFYWDPISRYGYNLHQVIQNMLNFKYKYIFRPVWSTNEVSGGSFGDLSQGFADLSSSPFLPTLPRRKLISPILNVGFFRSLFLFRTQRNEGLYGSVFLSPFRPLLWIVFGVVIVTFTIMLWIIFAIECRVIKYIRFIPSLLSAFLISFGLACVQSAALIPQTIGGRMVFFSLCVVTFLMYNYYTSSVVSSLVGSPIKSNIKNMEQLADSNLEVGIENIAYTHSYLRSATHPDIKKFIQKKLHGRMGANSTLWLKPIEGLEKVRKGGFAYHSEASTAYWLVEKYFEQHELCDLNEVFLRRETGLAVVLAKNSTYKEIMRINLIRMLETGVLSKHRRLWMKTKADCFANNILIKVGLEYTGPLFVFIGAAYAFSLCVLVLEIIHQRYTVRHP